MTKLGAIIVVAALVSAGVGTAVDEGLVAAGTLKMDGGVEAQVESAGQTITSVETTTSQEKRWSAQVSTDGRTVAGWARLGSAGREGYLDGRLAGDFVFGTVYGEAGEELGFFDGTLDAEGAVGTFTAIGGRKGSWSFPVAQ